MLNVKEIFVSIQGEGPYAGTPAVFIRMSGCNLSCDFCDTDHTSDAQQMSVEDILFSVILLTDQNKVNLVVITGGEPLTQELRPLLDMLYAHDYSIQIETNGTICLPELREYYHWNLMVVCSPKEDAPVDPRMATYVDAWKYLIGADTELDEQTGLPAKCTPPLPRVWEDLGRAMVFVQPLDSQGPEKNQKNIQKAVEVCIRYGYQLSTQVQKYLKIQ